MGSKGFLGEFEQLVLLSLVHVGKGGQGRAIHEAIEARSLVPVTITAVYVTLSRMEKKGLVSSRVGEPPPGGGRARKEFTIEAAGVEALRRSRAQLDRFWEGVELGTEGRP